MESDNTIFTRSLILRRWLGFVFFIVLVSSVLMGILGLFVLVVQVLIDGLPWISLHLFTDYASRNPEEAGLRAAIMGTVWLMMLTAALTIPVGIGSALYLEEYSSKNRLTGFIEINISNLAGVPSIVYGLLGLTLFVSWMALGRSVLAGAMTMALLVLPIVILASREAIKAVPSSHREAAYALGATRWEVVRDIVFPSAFPGMLTGIILAMSRAIGEAAPILAVSALVFLRFDPTGPMDRFTVLPIQIFNWVSRPQHEFRDLAAAGIIVLLVVLLIMNSIAVFIRNRYQSRTEE